MMKNQMAGSIKEGLKTLLSKPHTLRLVNFQVYIQVSAFPGKSPKKPVSRQTLRSPDFHVLQGYFVKSSKILEGLMQENEAQVKSWTFPEKAFSVGGINIR